MKASERRRKILEIVEEKGKISYKEILDELCELADPVDILCDLDTLVFFKFLQHVKSHGKSGVGPEAMLELRPHPRKKEKIPIKDDKTIVSRLEKYENDFPSWYRKRIVLIALSQGAFNLEDIFRSATTLCPHAKWSRPLIEISLKILEKSKFVSKQKTTYTLDEKGKSLLDESPIQQFITLKRLRVEFTDELRTCEIMQLVKENDESGISTGRILRYLASEYGVRGNEKRTIEETLKDMVFSGLLRVEGGTAKKNGHIFHLGKAAEPLFLTPAVVVLKHDITDFKKTVRQFFEKYKSEFKSDIRSFTMGVLDDLHNSKEDLSLKTPGEWAAHIERLIKYMKVRGSSWEKKMFRCIIVCALSRLLPADISVLYLKKYPPPPASKEGYTYYNGIAREYYFNLCEGYLDLQNEEMFSSFARLEVLCWESFDFLVIKGRIQMMAADMRNPEEFREVLNTFEQALDKSKGRERNIALFYKGLVHYRGGEFKKAQTLWEKCLESERFEDRKIMVRHNLASVYRILGNLEKAKNEYEKIISNNPENKESKLRALSNLANVFVDLCLWDEAQKTLEEIIQCKDPLLKSIAHTTMGVLLTRKGNAEKAIAHYTAAEGLIKKEENPEDYGAILINKGNTLWNLKKMDEAVAVLKEADAVIGRGAMHLIQMVRVVLADVYIEMGHLHKGQTVLHQILQERWRDDPCLEAEALRIKGKIHLHKGDMNTALEKFKQSEELFIKLHLNYELSQVYELMERCCKGTKEEIFYKNEKEKLKKQIGLT